jgi:hypothetical protein
VVDPHDSVEALAVLSFLLQQVLTPASLYSVDGWMTAAFSLQIFVVES